MLSLYPDYVPPHEGHPLRDRFVILERPRLGKAVQSLAAYAPGQWIARFDGVTVGYLTQHSLQKSPRLHLLDPFFAGLLSHACAPNAVLDMTRQNLHALRPIAPGDILTIDYEATEDELFAPFICACGAPECRGDIIGRKARASA